MFSLVVSATIQCKARYVTKNGISMCVYVLCWCDQGGSRKRKRHQLRKSHEAAPAAKQPKPNPVLAGALELVLRTGFVELRDMLRVGCAGVELNDVVCSSAAWPLDVHVRLQDAEQAA